MNYKELEPSIRRGIRTIVEYWEKLKNCEDIDDDSESVEIGILQLIEDSSFDRSDVTLRVETLCDVFFKRFGYSFQKARIIKEKLNDLIYSDELDYEYTIKLLKEFDKVSCCVSDLDVYPVILVESLCAITKLEKHGDMNQDLIKDIWYILSLYRGYPNSFIYRDYLEEIDYDYTENDFLSRDDRDELAEERYDDNIVEEYDPEECDPEVYGCSVKVRFANNKVYKYNCRFDEVYENNVVYVSGKMKNCKGTVTERMEAWDSSDYMEEVIDILDEE